MLTFELDPDGETLHLHGSPAGLRRLAEVLMQLAQKAESQEPDHVHLMTPDWGGTFLSAEPQGVEPGWKHFHHCKVMAWPDRPNISKSGT